MAQAARKKPSRDGTGAKNVVAAARGKSTQRREPVKLWETVKGLIPVIVVFLVIRTFLIEAYRIPSGSMEPTLLVGDFLFVNKLIFGPHIPFTDIHLPGYAEPKRGEVAVYKSPSQRLSIRISPDDSTPTVVKRLVGIGGDTLFMRGGVLYVNGIEQRYANASKPDPTIPDMTDSAFLWQREVGLRASRFGAAPDTPTHDNWGPFVLPPGHVFGLGDSRYASVDARYYGFVPRNNVRGRPLIVYYSHDCANSDVPLLCFITSVRGSRIGTRIR